MSTTAIAISLAVGCLFIFTGCIIYIRCFSKMEEEQEPWDRKSIDLNGFSSPPNVGIEPPERVNDKVLLAHDEDEEGSGSELFSGGGTNPTSREFSNHSESTFTFSREPQESKFTESTVERFFADLDKAQGIKRVESDSDDDIEV